MDNGGQKNQQNSNCMWIGKTSSDHNIHCYLIRKLSAHAVNIHAKDRSITTKVDISRWILTPAKSISLVEQRYNGVVCGGKHRTIPEYEKRAAEVTRHPSPSHLGSIQCSHHRGITKKARGAQCQTGYGTKEHV